MYSCYTELLDIELIISIKMDLAFNNLQRLIRHKPKKLTNLKIIYRYMNKGLIIDNINVKKNYPNTINYVQKIEL